MEPIEIAFYETLRALGQKQLDNLVIVGGWCPYLYAKHVWRKATPQLLTMDVDFAVKQMSPDKFSGPVYKKLLAAHLVPRRMDMDDDNRIQFSFLTGKSLVPIEFITAPWVLPKGQKALSTPYVACDPVPEVSLALRASPLVEMVEYEGQKYRVQVTSPGAFILVKALLLKHRVNSRKIPKDLASIAFVLRYSPTIENVLNEVKSLMQLPGAREGGKILAKVLAGEQASGFPWLRPFFETWGCESGSVPQEINNTFSPLMVVLSNKIL